MKFKKLKDEEFTKRIRITDVDGDILDVETHYEGKSKLFFCTNDGDGVFMSHKKALKLAWAIIDELSPVASS